MPTDTAKRLQLCDNGRRGMEFSYIEWPCERRRSFISLIEEGTGVGYGNGAGSERPVPISAASARRCDGFHRCVRCSPLPRPIVERR
jgi:hypothetical protein